ncbi:hypothetical protein BZK31_08350 [Pseudomonas floridensis]|uniref:Uncharacterized protein n=1 Tax=Pseudomonas floridensis TaxID=1958950 RepID=A0A1X0N838_9PSED|nr:hypothetical protein BZK31_08350 [Pseudomonas floridensis]
MEDGYLKVAGRQSAIRKILTVKTDCIWDCVFTLQPFVGIWFSFVLNRFTCNRQVKAVSHETHHYPNILAPADAKFRQVVSDQVQIHG